MVFDSYSLLLSVIKSPWLKGPDAGVDGIKLYFGMTPDIMEACLNTVDKRVPVTGHKAITASALCKEDELHQHPRSLRQYIDTG